MFGYERSELIDESIDLLVPATTRQDHRQHRDDYMSAPSLRPMGVGLTLNGRRRDGSEFPIDVLLKPVHGRAVPDIVTVVRDMTEHKRLEDTLTQARDSALRANEVKSRFLAAASHDLRQPLQTIWSLQALLSRVHANTEYAPQCALLEDAVRSMDQMLSSLIDINRLEKGAIQPVIRDFPLEEILPRLRSEFGYAASAKSLFLDIEDSTEFARSDPMLLPVIIRNLLGNAIKYTQHGTVDCACAREGSGYSSTSSIPDPAYARSTWRDYSMRSIKSTTEPGSSSKELASAYRSWRRSVACSITR